MIFSAMNTWGNQMGANRQNARCTFQIFLISLHLFS